MATGVPKNCSKRVDPSTFIYSFMYAEALKHWYLECFPTSEEILAYAAF